MKTLVVVFMFLVISPVYAESVDYQSSFQAEDIARRFFGPRPRKELQSEGARVASLNINFGTKIDCGKLTFTGNLDAEVKKIEKFLSGILRQMMRLGPGQLVLAAVCATEPELCTYIRDLGARLNEVLGFQIDACRVIDGYINDKAEEGRRSLIGRKYEKCIGEKAGRDNFTTDDHRSCLEQANTMTMRNLLHPFHEYYVNGTQNVLSSVLQVAQESKHYDLLSKVLGEVELAKNGYWVKAYPNTRLKPHELAGNFLAHAEDISCDLSRIEQIMAKDRFNDLSGIQKYVAEVVRDKVTPEIVFDLRSVPNSYRSTICRSLGDALGEIAIKRFEADSKSVLSVALKNNALPDDIRAFYVGNSEETFAALLKKVEAKSIPSFESTKDKLQVIAMKFRKSAHDVAADASKNRSVIKQQDSLMRCVDTATCEQP